MISLALNSGRLPRDRRAEIAPSSFEPCRGVEMESPSPVACAVLLGGRAGARPSPKRTLKPSR